MTAPNAQGSLEPGAVIVRSEGLRAPRLDLRPLSRADLDDAVRLGTDEQVMEYLAGGE